MFAAIAGGTNSSSLAVLTLTGTRDFLQARRHSCCGSSLLSATRLPIRRNESLSAASYLSFGQLKAPTTIGSSLSETNMLVTLAAPIRTGRGLAEGRRSAPAAAWQKVGIIGIVDRLCVVKSVRHLHPVMWPWSRVGRV